MKYRALKNTKTGQFVRWNDEYNQYEYSDQPTLYNDDSLPSPESESQLLEDVEEMFNDEDINISDIALIDVACVEIPERDNLIDNADAFITKHGVYQESCHLPSVLSDFLIEYLSK